MPLSRNLARGAPKKGKGVKDPTHNNRSHTRRNVVLVVALDHNNISEHVTWVTRLLLDYLDHQPRHDDCCWCASGSAPPTKAAAATSDSLDGCSLGRLGGWLPD